MGREITRVVANGNDMRIFREHDYVDVKGEAVNLAWKVLVKCDGMHTVDTDISAIKEPGRMPGSSSILFWLPRVYLLWSDILYL